MKCHLVDHLAITTFLVLPFLALETGCFSEHFYISRAFITFPYVIAKSSISVEKDNGTYWTLHHFVGQDVHFYIVNLFFQKIRFFKVLSPLQRNKSGFVLLPWRSHFWSLSNNLILILNSANWSVLPWKYFHI